MTSLDWRERKVRTDGGGHAGPSGKDEYGDRLDHNRHRFLGEAGGLVGRTLEERGIGRALAFGPAVDLESFESGLNAPKVKLTRGGRRRPDLDPDRQAPRDRRRGGRERRRRARVEARRGDAGRGARRQPRRDRPPGVGEAVGRGPGRAARPRRRARRRRPSRWSAARSRAAPRSPSSTAPPRKRSPRPKASPRSSATEERACSARSCGPGLRAWTAHHEEWGQEVRGFAIVEAEQLILVDPLLDGASGRSWRRPAASGRSTSWLTIHWHARSAGGDPRAPSRRDPLGLRARPRRGRRAHPGRPRLRDRRGAARRPRRARRRCRATRSSSGTRARAALIAGDVLLGDGAEGDGASHLCPESWLDGPSLDGAARATCAPVLDLPVELVLPAHGTPTLGSGAEALARALVIAPFRCSFCLQALSGTPGRLTKRERLQVRGQRPVAQRVDREGGRVGAHLDSAR